MIINRAKRFLLILVITPAIVALATITAIALASGSPDHDAFVSTSEPTTTHDGQSLDVAASLGPGNVCSPTETIYLQWDLAELSGSSVDTATLTLTATYASNTSLATLSLYQTNDGWNEGSLTSNNASPVGTLIQTVNAPPAGNPPSPATVTFSNSGLVTYINSQATGDGVVSFALRSSCSSTGITFVRFADEESGGNGPYLLMLNNNAARLHTLRTTNSKSMWFGSITLAIIILVTAQIARFTSRHRANRGAFSTDNRRRVKASNHNREREEERRPASIDVDVSRR